jgi:hypothetical protein
VICYKILSNLYVKYRLAPSIASDHKNLIK